MTVPRDAAVAEATGKFKLMLAQRHGPHATATYIATRPGAASAAAEDAHWQRGCWY